MIDGVYHVSFSSSSQEFGEGLVVIKDGVVNGGDHGYVYQGNVSFDGTRTSGRLIVKRWNSSVTSVFGNIAQYELELSGSQRPDRSFLVSGNVVGQQALTIDIAGKFIAEVA